MKKNCQIVLDRIMLYQCLLLTDSAKLFGNNKITFILSVPIVHSQLFDLFRLYPIPIYLQSKFITIIPKETYLIKNELHFDDSCAEITPKAPFARKMTCKI
nr:unnamed protein product [Callosobruchus chinensis]